MFQSYLYAVYKKNFGVGAIFFSGKIGSWKEYFSEQHKQAAKEAIGSLLIRLKYERGYDW